MAPSAPIGDKKNIVKMAYIYFQEGRWDKAIEEYKKLLVLDPEDINTHNMLGDVYVKKGSVREAYEEYSKVSAELTARGQSDKSAVVNKKIAALDTDVLPPEARNKQNLIKRTLKAETAMEQGDYQTAIEAFSDVLKLDPENISVYSKLADLLVSKGKIEEAIQQYAVMGTAFLKNRLYKKAQEAFQKIIELDPNQVEARVNLAQIFIKQGSESDAKKEFLTVAEIFLRQGDLDKAQQYSQKSIELKGIEAYYILGQVLFKKRQFAEAKTEFDNLLRFKVNHVGGLTFLGQVFLELNQLDKASEQFNKAQKIDKENPRVLEALADLNVKKGAKTEAVSLLIQVSKWYAGKKDFKKAVEAGRKAEAVDNQSPVALRALGEVLQEEGQKTEAAQCYVRAADLYDKKNQQAIGDPLRKLAKDLTASENLSLAAEIAAPAASPAADATPASVVAPSPSVEPPAAPHADAPSVPVPPAMEAMEPPSENVVDLDAEAPPPAVEAPPAPPALTAEQKSAEQAADRDSELRSQMEIASNYVKQDLVEDAIEIYQQLLQDYPNHPEVKAQLNAAYTLYVKGGDEVIGALEAEKKAKEEEEKRLREEIERRSREEQERKLRAELERKGREEAERRVREEAELKAREEALLRAKTEADRKARTDDERRMREDQLQKAKIEAERLLRDESERKAKAEADKKFHEEMERKAKEEAEKKLREVRDRKAREDDERRRQADQGRRIPETPSLKSATPSPGRSDRSATQEESRDDFMTIAVADIYVRQGLYDEAQRIYRRIVDMEPDNYEAKKKLTDLENMIKAKGLSGVTLPPVVPAPGPPPSAPAPAPMSAPPPAPKEHPVSADKEPVAKKKPGKVGYV